MKKISLLSIAFPLYLLSYSYTNKDIDTVIYNLCKEIMVKDPMTFTQENYVELAYLKRKHNLTALHTNDSLYLSKVFNNFYYDQYYLYGKFLNDNAIVTEDCMFIPESTDGSVHMANKLLIYVIYPNSIQLPKNIVELIDENSTVDEFLAPYKMLTTIYYIKKYNYNNLSTEQVSKLVKIEDRLSKLLYSKYIDNLPWSSYRLLAVKVLKMNRNELVNNIDITELIEHYKNNKPLFYFEGDRKYASTLGKIGGNRVLEYDACALLWIFLLEIK